MIIQFSSRKIIHSRHAHTATEAVHICTYVCIIYNILYMEIMVQRLYFARISYGSVNFRILQKCGFSNGRTRIVLFSLEYFSLENIKKNVPNQIRTSPCQMLKSYVQKNFQMRLYDWVKFTFHESCSTFVWCDIYLVKFNMALFISLSSTGR